MQPKGERVIVSSPSREMEVTIGRRLSQEDYRNNNNLPDGDTTTGPQEDSPESLGSIVLGDEYLEDNILELTTLQEEYLDPSHDYEFVNCDTGWFSHLDNSEALLQQLSALGIRVPKDYITLDIDDTTHSRTASVSTSSEGEDNWHECWREEHYETLAEEMEDEVVQAEILPSGNVQVKYENLQKNYSPRISPQKNFHLFLTLGQSNEEETTPGDKSSSVGICQPSPCGEGEGGFPQRVDVSTLKRKIVSRLDQIRQRSPIKSLHAKCASRIRKLRADEISYDAMTPDSGVHESFATLSPEEQEKQREDWKTDLAKTEDEIQTLRQVLASKVKHAQDLKRRLGITVWREFSDDISSSFRSVKESQPVQKANEVLGNVSEAVAAAPLYQKTAGAMSAVSEKTGAIFGGIGAKFGALKETPTFKSFEERVGSVYTTAKVNILEATDKIKLNH